MPYACVVFGCSNRSNREKDKRFFRVPREVTKEGGRVQGFRKRRREKWLSNIALQSKGAESKNARVCSDHFVKGQPGNLYDDQDVDWAPTVKMGHDTVKEKPKTRDGRGKTQQEKRKLIEGAEALLDFHKVLRMKMETPEPEPGETDDGSTDVKAHEIACQTDFAEEMETSEPDSEEVNQSPTPVETREIASQTDLKADYITRMEDELISLNSELYGLRAKVLETALTKEGFEKSDAKTKFYTGFPNFPALMQLFSLCEPYISVSPMSSLDKFQQLLLVLMRLRLNLPILDLAYRFQISQPTASRICNKVLSVLHERLQFLIEWPEGDLLRHPMPKVPEIDPGETDNSSIDLAALRSSLKDLQTCLLAHRPGQTTRTSTMPSFELVSCSEDLFDSFLESGEVASVTGK
ncbi:uncharacterized protein LOC133634844 isoform X1 [Entelurus aequoreus]|uniref:uncharacterized protein LOC133634844 isoform X1 n=1 Tax=Entelurus aequoreus TaxID=161455 RepID=UPI002B1E21BB|nr:uncharacterized protein LOC133634844 isoform X1 [Entelurus aequoreus]